MSAFGGKSDNKCSRRAFPLLTRNGHCGGVHFISTLGATALGNMPSNPIASAWRKQRVDSVIAASRRRRTIKKIPIARDQKLHFDPSQNAVLRECLFW